MIILRSSFNKFAPVKHSALKHVFLITVACFSGITGWTQQKKVTTDTAFSKELNEVVVTATRNERKLSNVAVPVNIISQKTIQQAASRPRGAGPTGFAPAR